jgi:hypothetical protein
METAMNPFEFYSQVYGIESFVGAPSGQAEAGPVVSAKAETLPSAQPWLAFTTNLTNSEFQAYSEMFGKITTALGLSAHEFALYLQDQSIPDGVSVHVAFGGSQMGWQETSETTKQLVVSSLQDMAQNPELKKSAWSFLKKIMDHRRID